MRKELKEFMIYFDAASTSYDIEKTFLIHLLKDPPGNPYRSSASPSIKAMSIMEDTRIFICNHIQAPHPRFVAFTSGATQSMNLLLDAFVPYDAKLVTSLNEHNSVYRPIDRQCRQKNCSVQYVNNNEDGRIDLDHLESLLKNKDVFAVIINHASNVTGVIQDLDKISAICMKYDSYFFVDAAQSVGFCELDMRNTHIDGLVFSGHKRLGALMGTGVLAISERLEKLDKFEVISGGTGNLSFNLSQSLMMPALFEAGTPNMPGILSLKYAYQMENINRSFNFKSVLKMKCDLLKYTQKFRERLAKIEDFTVYGPAVELPKNEDDFTNLPIMSFNYRNIPSSLVENYLLDRVDLVCRSGIHCAPMIHKFYGTEKQGMVRFSFSYFNDKYEMSEVIDILKSAKEEFKDYKAD